MEGANQGGQLSKTAITTGDFNGDGTIDEDEINPDATGLAFNDADGAYVLMTPTASGLLGALT